MRKFLKNLFLLSSSIFLLIILINLAIYKYIDPTLKTERGVFLSKHNLFKSSNKEYDTVFWGSSQVLHQISPKIFDSITGHKSFNFGISACFTPQCTKLFDYMLDSFIEKKIKTIFFELHTRVITDENFRAESNYYNSNIGYDLETMIFYTLKPKLESIRNYFSCVFFKYTRALVLIFKKNNLGFDKELDIDSGFSPNPSLKAMLTSKSLRPPQKTFLEKKFVSSYELQNNSNPISPFRTKYYTNYLNKLLERCDANDIEVILIISPTVNINLINWQNQDLFAMRDFTILDFSSKKKYPELYQWQLYNDPSHFNKEGAELYSRILAEAVLNMHS